MHRTLENLGSQVWAELILFEYLRFKIPVGRDQNTQFCTEHWRIWVFRCGQEQHISISSILNSFQKASKHPVFHRTLENLGFKLWAGAILFELLLFKITWGRHQNTQFCTEDWRIWTFRGGQWAGMILCEWLVTCLYIFYIDVSGKASQHSVLHVIAENLDLHPGRSGRDHFK